MPAPIDTPACLVTRGQHSWAGTRDGRRSGAEVVDAPSVGGGGTRGEPRTTGQRRGLPASALYAGPVSRFSAWSLLAVFGIGVFLAGLELMITATALPSILLDLAVTDELGKPAFAELRHASWIVNGYLLAYVIAMPLAGRLADVWGARRLFLGALVVFIAGSLVAGRGQSLDELIAGRIVQGVGGGILVPVGTAAASHLFEGHDRPRALGIVGGLTFLGMAAGPFLGAALLGGLDVSGGLSRLGIGE